ncbi:hypothetical protein AB0N05_35315 [Nocardia sp. NPDC051030]|uniref:hypothetical protein n=1 Tax=Nocardia sp. NPDC051030 TaxID=3155162 RepID=UPI003449F432
MPPISSTPLTTLKAAQRQLLLKPLDAAVFLAPWPTSTPVTPGNMTDASGNLLPLPAAYQSVGLIDKKSGISFARAVTAAPIEAYGEMQPVRDDITSDVTSIEFEPQQISLLNMALTTNTNLSAVQANSSSGEVGFWQPATPQINYYSAVVIGKDGTDANPIYIFKIMPKVAVTKWGGEQWTPTNLMSEKLTLTAFKDDALGYAVAHGFGGSGWKQLLASTGFKYNATGVTAAPMTVSRSTTSASPLVVSDQFGGVVSNGNCVFTPAGGSGLTVNSAGYVTTAANAAVGNTTVGVVYTPAGGSALPSVNATITVN